MDSLGEKRVTRQSLNAEDEAYGWKQRLLGSCSRACLYNTEMLQILVTSLLTQQDSFSYLEPRPLTKEEAVISQGQGGPVETSSFFSLQPEGDVLGLTSASPDSQAVKYPSSSCTLKRTVGASVQLPLTSPLNSSIREIEWNWQPENDENTQLVTWKPQTPTPDCLTLIRTPLPTPGTHTQLVEGRSAALLSPLTLDPIPHPQIQIRSSSNTSGWCNISLECEIPGNTGNLTVIWLSQGLPRHLEQRGIPPNSRNLSLSLPISHINSHLTCVVSNPAEEKNATLHLEDICPWRGGSTLLPTDPQALPTEESTNLQTVVANSLDPPYEEISVLRHHKA
ncbi:CD48 [Cervus elaphus hippelaphus]|uniref:CD48 n=1 Tax=Cervus elaphus hippelaphus TaxID=46360 RepID=A0A212CH84_CEREH|nr:CD48 [Cervus elaphus hippelaphus]